jgi:rhamnosyltransferase
MSSQFQMEDRRSWRAAHRPAVCAILVTYHPDRDFPGRISRLLGQVEALIIVDNGSNDSELKMLRDLSSSTLIVLQLNFDNLGVARALNIGIRRAVTLGFEWALLLDQDSRVDENMVQTLFTVHASFPHRDRLAVIGSGFLDVNRQAHVVSEEVHEESWEEVESVITSGSLLPLSNHALIGPFREEFFIDYVDSEYCFRARAKGFRVIKTRKPLMSHAIGAATEHSVLWMSKWTSNHSADRRYYIARNDTVMLREYGNYALGLWALKSLSRRLRSCKRIALYEKMKASKIIAVAEGWWDGVRGHLGPRAHA